MSDELFLIIHKVRGEPAFDVAHRLQIGEEEGWIIPTSGHRAYPIETLDLSRLRDMDSDCLIPTIRDWALSKLDRVPDHYNLTREPTTASRSFSSLLSLVKKAPKLKIRRAP